eukprot:6192724-Pleurochrysis_carterae.AAC.1
MACAAVCAAPLSSANRAPSQCADAAAERAAPSGTPLADWLHRKRCADEPPLCGHTQGAAGRIQDDLRIGGGGVRKRWVGLVVGERRVGDRLVEGAWSERGRGSFGKALGCSAWENMRANAKKRSNR